MTKGHAVRLVALTIVILACAAFAPAFAKDKGEAQRPLTDWTESQNDTNVFFTPAPDIVGLGTGDDPPLQPLRWALVDHAGAVGAWLRDDYGIELGTQVEGTVIESPMPDGRVRVHVNTHATNAMTWITDMSTEWPGPNLFGASPLEIRDGQPAGIGDCTLDVVFINPGPGQPLPSLLALIGILGTVPEGTELERVAVRLVASGALHAAFGVPEGTPGRATIIQTGLLKPQPASPQWDLFPVEVITLKETGR